MLRVLSLFAGVGTFDLGLERAGPFRPVAFCEINPARRAVLRERFPGVLIHDDIRTFNFSGADIVADIIVGGPPCQATAKPAAVHGKRTGESLWSEMFLVIRNIRPDWVVVEQPPGNATWEAEVTDDLRDIGRHVARFEFGACDVGAPYLRRRVFLVACTSLPRLEVARSALPSAIDRVKRAADARGDWDAGKLRALRVDARSAGEMDRTRSAGRRERIEALGDANPPHMAEAIGLAIAQALKSVPSLSSRVIPRISPRRHASRKERFEP